MIVFGDDATDKEESSGNWRSIAATSSKAAVAETVVKQGHSHFGRTPPVEEIPAVWQKHHHRHQSYLGKQWDTYTWDERHNFAIFGVQFQ